MPSVKKSSLSGVKRGRPPVSEWFPLKDSVARSLNATSHLAVFCSFGNHNGDPRQAIQDSFRKALERRCVPCLDSVVPITPEMAQSHLFIYVPIGNTKKNEYWNYLYQTRDELCDFIMTLEARMLAIKMAKIPPTEYTLPLQRDRWNVLLAIHPTLSGHWKTAERRAITGEGVNILEDKSMMPDHIGYKLAAEEVSKANLRSKTQAGWVSATGTSRNHQHGKPYSLARPIHTIHNKSRAVRSDSKWAKTWARDFTRSYRSPSVESDITMRTASPPPEDNLAQTIHTIHNKSRAVRSDSQWTKTSARDFTRSYRSPSVESDITMRTASPPPEEHSHEQYDDADETPGTVVVLSNTHTQDAETSDPDAKVEAEHVDRVPHSASTTLPTEAHSEDAKVAMKPDSSTKTTDAPADHTEPSAAESKGEETLDKAEHTDSDEADDSTVVSSAHNDEDDIHSEEELAINGPGPDANDTPVSPSTTDIATPTAKTVPFAPFAGLDPALFKHEANEADFPPRVAPSNKKALDRTAKLWLERHCNKNKSKHWIH
ncbi:hypothetical protein JCM24511_06354 [Saitozyma sp. JCM 24511]|nr:hypothetical protein JCM24511_06354 [Saitozyma sp. JCM 24511]